MRRGFPAPRLKPERSHEPAKALCAFVSLWVAFTTALPLEAADPKAQLEACIEEFSGAPQGAEEERPIVLSASCPGLSSAFERAPVKPLLDQGLGPTTSLSQLRDLHALLTAYEAPYKVTNVFDYDGLQDLLARTLIEASSPNPSWWQRFLAWLSHVLEQPRSGENPWLVDFLKRLVPLEWLIRWLLLGAMILIVVLALMVIVNELRHAKLTSWWKKRRRDRIRTTDQGTSPRPRTWTWEEVVALPPGRQPGALLRFIIHRLVQQGLLPNNFSLTNGELLARLYVVDQQRAGHFRTLVLGAEPVLYGNRPPEHAHLEGLVHAADQLRA